MTVVQSSRSSVMWIFFFNDTATTDIYTLSLHDALPISSTRWSRTSSRRQFSWRRFRNWLISALRTGGTAHLGQRSEEHTSELQSRQYIVCCLLLEKKKRDKPFERGTASQGWRAA